MEKEARLRSPFFFCSFQSSSVYSSSGDSQKWKENTKREWDKYTFGCYGCWVMGDDGNLDYVPEEEYTEELWNEQKKNGERNRASFSMHK